MSMLSFALWMRFTYVKMEVSGEKNGVTVHVLIQYVGLKRASYVCVW